LPETVLKPPADCSAAERAEFARLVRLGFEGSDAGLDERIRNARWLAFHYAADDTVVAIAGLKVPPGTYRDEVFRQARASAEPAQYRLELGWIFVMPAHRGQGMAGRLCRQLLAREPDAGVFSLTRPVNGPMARILGTLGFMRSGRPYRRRDHRLVLFLRPGAAAQRTS
jgi:GNAT superfamily N-acetyltransferase